MIHKKIVFILGAGASSPLGFPTGKGLYEGIIGNLKSVDKKNKLLALGISSKEVNDLRDRLQYATDTIDTFLRHNPGLIRVGKTAIAQVLIPAEDKEKFLIPSDKGNWYRILRDIMVVQNSLSDVAQNKVSFLTFNYDRSLEHFLFTTSTNLYGDAKEEECVKVLSKIPIVHLHGKLGDLPWENKNKNVCRLYSPETDEVNLLLGRQGIKIAHEAKDEDSEFVRARELLREAECIYFFGFGYDPTNLKRLKIESLQPKYIRGTAYNLHERERGIIRQNSGNKIDLAPHTYDCVDFIRDIVID